VEFWGGVRKVRDEPSQHSKDPGKEMGGAHKPLGGDCAQGKSVSTLGLKKTLTTEVRHKIKPAQKTSEEKGWSRHFWGIWDEPLGGGMAPKTGQKEYGGVRGGERMRGRKGQQKRILKITNGRAKEGRNTKRCRKRGRTDGETTGIPREAMRSNGRKGGEKFGANR